MNDRRLRRLVQFSMLAGMILCVTGQLPGGVRNWAAVVGAGSKLHDVSLAELSKLCKGTQKAWPDGRNFTLVVRNPDSPEMKTVLLKIFGATDADLKVALAKLSETKSFLKVVDSDEDVIRTVGATPGAVGIMDVYAINSAVKVLRVDGKLPFDAGYSLKGN